MTSGVFLSTTSVVALLAGVALLAVVSALTLAPLLGRYAGRYVAAFWVCLVGIWLGAVVAIVLSKRTV
jgi:uncharacterized protein (DUF697 family)